VGSDRAGQARRSRWWQPRPGKRLVIGVGALALTAGMCLTPVAAGTAQAASAPAGPAGELKAGSAHAILNAHDQLAMPLPRLASDFSVKRNANGSATVGFALTYGVANTKSSKRVRADDATVVVRVARQAGSTGPSPADPVFTKVFVDNRLSRPTITHHYSVTIPAAAVSFLKSKGLAFKQSKTGSTTTTVPSTAPTTTKALRLITVDVQQHRDFQRVDGGYDWTEGNFFTAAGHPLATAGSHSGTLSVLNTTNLICNYKNKGSVTNYGDPDTFNTCTQSDMATPVQLSGINTECTDQDTDSDPQGFAQETNTVGTPLAPGGSVTEPVVADDSASILAQDLETVNAGWAVSLGKIAVTSVADLLLGGPFGTIIEAGLELSAYFSGTSCANDPNVMTLSATATTGGAGASYGWSMDEEGMQDVYGTNFADGNGGPLKAVQLASSSQIYDNNGTGQYPWLAENVTRNCGVGNGTSACDTETNSHLNIEWTTNDPCPGGQAYTFNGVPQSANSPVCAGPVPASPGVTSCGTNNSTCPSQTEVPFSVPNVVGDTYSQATSTLAAADLGIYPTNVSPTVKITGQTPGESNGYYGTARTPFVVQVTVPPATHGPRAVPDVIGLTETKAGGVIQAAGFYATLRGHYTRTGIIVFQTPPAGTQLGWQESVIYSVTKL
jgi:hypothetical protein